MRLTKLRFKNKFKKLKIVIYNSGYNKILKKYHVFS